MVTLTQVMSQALGSDSEPEIELGTGSDAEFDTAKGWGKKGRGGGVEPGDMYGLPSCRSMASKLCRYSWERASSAEQRRVGSKASSRPSKCTAASPALPKCLPTQHTSDQT